MTERIPATQQIDSKTQNLLNPLHKITIDCADDLYVMTYDWENAPDSSSPTKTPELSEQGLKIATLLLETSPIQGYETIIQEYESVINTEVLRIKSAYDSLSAVFSNLSKEEKINALALYEDQRSITRARILISKKIIQDTKELLSKKTIQEAPKRNRPKLYATGIATLGLIFALSPLNATYAHAPDTTEPIIIQEELLPQAKHIKEDSQPFFTSKQKEQFEKSILQVSGRDFVLTGEQGTFVGDYIQRTDTLPFDDEMLQQLYEIQTVFNEKRTEFDNHLAIDLPLNRSLSIEVADADFDQSGAITDRFDVMIDTPMHVEISGIEITKNNDILFKFDSAYTGDGKTLNEQKSGTVFIKMDPETALTLLQQSKKGVSSAFFAVNEPYYITNVSAGLSRINNNSKNVAGSYSLIQATEIDKSHEQLINLGYVNGYAIVGLEVQETFAGGICGASSVAWNTIIRAFEANNIDFKIITQKQHSLGGGYTPGINQPTSQELPLTITREATIFTAEQPEFNVDAVVSFPDGTLTVKTYTLFTNEDGTKGFFLVNATTSK